PHSAGLPVGELRIERPDGSPAGGLSTGAAGYGRGRALQAARPPHHRRGPRGGAWRRAGEASVSSSPPHLHVQLRKRHASGRSYRFDLEAAFAAAPGVTVIGGHSGAGKTTILRCIAGLCDPEEGRIAVGDRVLFDASRGIKLEPARRGVAVVFQDLALFPHLSVQDNVMYGLRRLEAPERQRRMREILESFQIAHLRGRSPREISGGEQQRVALARSLVTEPSV